MKKTFLTGLLATAGSALNALISAVTSGNPPDLSFVADPARGRLTMNTFIDADPCA